MKREDVSKIFENATDEQINAILDIHSRDIGNAKKDYESLQEELKKSNGTIDTMTKELNSLKDANASSEDWKKKFEKLEDDILEEKRIAKEQKEAAGKEAEILNRFNRVCVDKDGNALEFIHDAIKADYVKKSVNANFIPITTLRLYYHFGVYTEFGKYLLRSTLRCRRQLH